MENKTLIKKMDAPMFPALFAIAKIWNNRSTDMMITNKSWYMFSSEILSPLQKECYHLQCLWMGLENIIQRKYRFYLCEI